jgi:hypothetical protein
MDGQAFAIFAPAGGCQALPSGNAMNDQEVECRAQ